MAGTRATAAAEVADASVFKTATGGELVPNDRHWMKEFKGMEISMLTDGDPRTAQVMKKMYEARDDTPAKNGMGIKVTISTMNTDACMVTCGDGIEASTAWPHLERRR